MAKLSTETRWTLAVFGVALCVRLIRLDHTPQWDEMYHLLAGQSWLRDGSFAIADGQYTRAPLFTMIVGAFMGVFGEGLVSARLPSVLSGSLGVALLYRFTAVHAGRTAGLLAAGLLCFHPLSIYLGQLVRFYALHALCFWVGAYGVFQVLDRPRLEPRTAIWAGVALISLVFAYQLQVTTLVGIGALVIWGGLRLTWNWVEPIFQRDSRAAWFLAAVGVGGLIAGAVAWQLGFFEYLFKYFRHTPNWGEGTVTDRRFYDRWFTRDLPALWTLFPLAGLIAMRHARSFAFFALCVFGIIFVTHSLAAAKAYRFIFYGLPFFVAIWGIALAALAPALGSLLHEVISGAFQRPAPAAALRCAVALCVAGLVGFLLLTNPAARHSYQMLLYSDADWPMPHRYRGFADWKSAAPTLEPMVKQSSVLLTSSGVKSLYFLGRTDFDISVTQLYETDTDGEFGIDPRIGRPVISTAESLATIMRQHRSGLVVIEKPRWRVPFNVPDEIADYLEANTQVVRLDARWRLMAFRWQN